jgi:hypothetical protein
MLKQKVLCRAHKNARCDMCLRAKHARERFNEHATRTSALFCQSKFVLANEAAQEPLHRRSCHLLRAQQACLIRAGESAHLAEEVCGLLGCQEEGGLLRSDSQEKLCSMVGCGLLQAAASDAARSFTTVMQTSVPLSRVPHDVAIMPVSAFRWAPGSSLPTMLTMSRPSRDMAQSH